MRIDFDFETLLEYLPAIYREDDRSRDFLARLLTHLQSLYLDIDDALAGLAKLSDPEATSKAYLPWLANWLALDLDEAWNEERQRGAVRDAFAGYAQRGTSDGLRRALRSLAGVDVRIEEPILHMQWWSLAEDDIDRGPAARTEADVEAIESEQARRASRCWSLHTEVPDASVDADAVGRLRAAEHSVLGVTTMLAGAEPQGAVVGTTAIVDGSHLITDADHGAPLFDDVAHRFTVLMYRGRSYGAEIRDEVRDVIERERPAHTTYHLCVVEPRLRIGFQARIGVDTVIAGPPSPAVLDEQGGSPGVLVLAGDPPGRIGSESQIGKTTRLDGGP